MTLTQVNSCHFLFLSGQRVDLWGWELFYVLVFYDFLHLSKRLQVSEVRVALPRYSTIRWFRFAQLRWPRDDHVKNGLRYNSAFLAKIVSCWVLRSELSSTASVCDILSCPLLLSSKTIQAHMYFCSNLNHFWWKVLWGQEKVRFWKRNRSRKRGRKFRIGVWWQGRSLEKRRAPWRKEWWRELNQSKQGARERTRTKSRETRGKKKVEGTHKKRESDRKCRNNENNNHRGTPSRSTPNNMRAT